MTLEDRLAQEITGDVLFDPFNRGRYATDASFYQIMPAGVVLPRTIDEALRALAICRDHGRIVTPRGGGTSQCGQTVNEPATMAGSSRRAAAGPRNAARPSMTASSSIFPNI